MHVGKKHVIMDNLFLFYSTRFLVAIAILVYYQYCVAYYFWVVKTRKTFYKNEGYNL